MKIDLSYYRDQLFKELYDSGISLKTINAMKKIHREKFIPLSYRHLAYENRPISIGKGQTISQPYIVGRMIDLLNIKKNNNILEIGTGSGYNLAVLSKLAKHITSVERIKSLSINAKKSLKKEDINNITLTVGDGTLGYSKNAPYDKIIVTTGATKLIPVPLLDQLKIGGIMIIPKKNNRGEILLRIVKRKTDFEFEKLDPVKFVPLIGKFGY